MKSNSFLLGKRMISEKVSLYDNKNFTLDFKFKHLDFYNEIYYLRKLRIFDLIFLNIKKYTYSFLKKKKLNFSILLTNDAEIQEINLKYRNIYKPTNVLSFKCMIDERSYFKNTEKEIHLGEIIISMERIFIESKINNVLFKDHFIHIFLHAILHILGYDHEKDSERKKMENIEISILKNLRIKNPYA